MTFKEIPTDLSKRVWCSDTLGVKVTASIYLFLEARKH